MMRDDYVGLLQELQESLKIAGFGYAVIEESELSAVLFLSIGWSLVFEGEKYYGPAFNISISPSMGDSQKNRLFSVFLLMRVFEKKYGKSYGKPSIQNQVNFLAKERVEIFSSIKNYEFDYDLLNEK